MQSQASKQDAETERTITLALGHKGMLGDGSWVHMPVHMLGFACSC